MLSTALAFQGNPSTVPPSLQGERGVQEVGKRSLGGGKEGVQELGKRESRRLERGVEEVGKSKLGAEDDGDLSLAWFLVSPPGSSSSRRRFFGTLDKEKAGSCQLWLPGLRVQCCAGS